MDVKAVSIDILNRELPHTPWLVANRIDDICPQSNHLGKHLIHVLRKDPEGRRMYWPVGLPKENCTVAV